MLARKRFKPAEREVFTMDAQVQWRHVSHWKPGTITGPIAEDDAGWQYVSIRNDAPGTRTVGKGDVFRAYPGNIRPVQAQSNP